MFVIDRHKQVGNGGPGLASKRATQTGHAAEPMPSETTASRNGRITVWFGKWRQPIRSWFSSSAVPSGEVDDLAQEVFLRLLRYSDDVAVENPQGYLFRIAANVASEWRGLSRVRRPHKQSWLDELQIDPAAQPDNSAFQGRISKHLQGAVNKLPPRQRQVLLLHVNDGLTYKQIADRLGLTYRIVLRDLTRAYGELRMQLRAQDL